MLVFDLIISMLLISGISMAALGLYGKRFVDRVPAATPYVLLMFCAAAWAILYALDLLTLSLPLRVIYHDLRFLILPFFSVLELWLVIAYIKKPGWLRRDWAVLALIIPLAAAVLGVTSQYHTLFRYNFSINTSGPVPLLQYSESPFYLLYFLYSFIFLILAILLLINETRKQGTLREGQTILLVLALAIPTVINYASQTGLTPIYGINMAPVLLWIPAIMYTVALFRYRFLDIVPIARSRLIETMSTPVMVLDIDGRIIDMNPAACALLSCSLAGGVGKPVGDIAPDWPEFLDLCRAGSSDRSELVRTRNGEIRYFSGSRDILLAQNGEVEGYLIFLQDITERKRIEVALRESEEKYRSIIENMQDMFYRTDLEGKITMLSPSAARLAGHPSVDYLLGRDAGTMYADPAERDKFLEVLRRDGSVYGYPATLKLHDGTLVFVTVSSHYYRDAQGIIRGVEGVIHNITELKHAEDALRMANTKLNLLASITRHDIRNQLFALMAFLELSEEVLDKPAELAEYLKRNRKIAENIASQIMFTKDYEDLGIQAPSWQNVSTVVEKAVSELPIRNIRISIEVAGLEIFADPLVEKVFYNLIDNALRYGGETMTNIRICTYPSGQSLVLVFEDNGVGIPDRDKKTIFDKGVGKNTGLGLYLSREILSITGISIAETGAPGKSARFEITVPEGGFRLPTQNTSSS